MKKRYLNILLAFLLVLSVLPLSGTDVYAASYMSNKTEIPVDLEVSGAEAICQTADGYIWIAQYSGLVCYDSKEFTSYKSFEYEGQEYSLINARALAAKGNTLYIATSEQVYVHKDHHFEPLLLGAGVITDMILDEKNDRLYLSTQNDGGVVYDINAGTKSIIPGSEGKYVRDIALDTGSGEYYYLSDGGAYDHTGRNILPEPRILELYSYDTVLYLAEETGVIHRYDMTAGRHLSDITVPDQVNKLLYSAEDQILFAACEKNGIYCIDLSESEPVITLAGDLNNKSQLVDLMIDYEGNLWVASHYIGASGVSIITRNALSELLYDDPVWQALNAPPAFDRNVYAVEKYGDILYIVAASRIYRYDTVRNMILPDNVIMQTIDEYAEARTREGKAQGDSNFTFIYAPKDVEVFKNKVYFAVASIGLVEYDPAAEEVVIYDQKYIADHLGKIVGEPDISIT
ncbi:MAG: hypothetical protein IKI65_00605, partial [Firmicutes bacterium]|nr:hypothetical protein [Bacillota bacterium]